jgi:AraC family transcriptional regulator
MSLTARVLAHGAGWRVMDVVCDAGPKDRPFEECHAGVSVALVTSGTFQYRSSLGSAVLAPGGVLLGNPGSGFECAHEHGRGDRCLAFHYSPELFERIVADAVRRPRFGVPSLPPVAAVARVVASAEVARDEEDREALEELAFAVAGVAAEAAGQSPRARAEPAVREQRRVTEALRRIERHANEPLSLVELARDVAMSPWHFLRTFRRVTGVTPHQYILTRRLHRAAVLLRTSDAAVGEIALDAGFGDLSTFNRQFRRTIGASPSAWRQASGVRHQADANGTFPFADANTGG